MLDLFLHDALGHHAEKDQAMGFCCISNAGVATNYLISKYKYQRIACVDFDVHWGNGNYDVMRGNKNSLYISTHQYPFYPRIKRILMCRNV